MRGFVLTVLALGCGGAPPPSSPSPTVAAEPVPVLVAVAPKPVVPEPPPPPARRFPVAWHTANAGKNTPRGTAVAFRDDGSLVVTGQGEAEAWTAKPKRKLARMMPHFIASLDASGKPQWVRIVDVGNGSTESLATGPDGSVLVTGWFSKQLTIEGKVAATSAGETDIFVARFERDGRLAWAVRAGSRELDLAESIAVAPDGTSYVTGSISGEATFGSLTAKHAGDRDVFLAAFDPKGVPLWVSTAGGTDGDEARGVALTPNAVCITGYFGGVSKFQTITLTMPEPQPGKVANPSNAFVACHARNGDVRWAERIGTHTSFDRGWAITALGDGSVVVTGDHSERSFVARYAAGGTLLWFHHATGNSTARGIVALPGDEILVTAYLVEGDLVLPGRTRSITLQARGSDSVLAHYTGSGELLGAGRVAGVKGRSGDERNGDEVEMARLAASPTGRVAMTGRLWGTAAFDEGDLLVPSTATIKGPSGTDLILVVLDPARP